MIALHRAFIFLTLISMNFVYAMQEDAVPDEITVSGEMWIVENAFHYECGTHDIHDDWPDFQARFHLPTQPNDPLVHVWAKSEDSKDWEHDGHPILGRYFSPFLPLSLLADKKENDVITIPFDKQQAARWLRRKYDKLTITLTCKQIPRSGPDTFEQVLARLRMGFAYKPNFSLRCENNLIAAGVLKKLKNEKIVIGPNNGFLTTQEYEVLEKRFEEWGNETETNPYLQRLSAIHSSASSTSKKVEQSICAIN